MNRLLWLLCVFVVFISNVRPDRINCTINFELDLETDEDTYLTFMTELEKLTFSLAENCPDPLIIDELVWEYRYDLYEAFKDNILLCQCKESEEEFKDCMATIRADMTLDVTEKYSELESLYCSNDNALDEDIF